MSAADTGRTGRALPKVLPPDVTVRRAEALIVPGEPEIRTYPFVGVSVVFCVSSGRMVSCCEALGSALRVCGRTARRRVDGTTTFIVALTVAPVEFVT